MADNIDIKDGAGANVTVKTTEGAGPGYVNVPHHIVDSVVASALPAGAATEATLATIDADTGAMVVDLAAMEVLSTAANALLTTIDSDTNDIKTAVELIDNAISGSEMQVDVVTVTLPADVYHGQTDVTTAGTEVTLASSQAILSGVTIKAKSANTGLIYVGANPVTSSTGFELNAKESVFLEVANLTTVFVDAAVNGEGVSYIAT